MKGHPWGRVETGREIGLEIEGSCQEVGNDSQVDSKFVFETSINRFRWGLL